MYTAITRRDTMLQEYYITKRCKNMIYKYTHMYSTKSANELQQGSWKLRRRGWKKRTPDGLSLIHQSTTARSDLHKNVPQSKLRDLNMQVYGVVKKQSNEYVKWKQVTCTGKHTFIDKSKSENIYQKTMSWVKHAQAWNEISSKYGQN